MLSNNTLGGAQPTLAPYPVVGYPANAFFGGAAGAAQPATPGNNMGATYQQQTQRIIETS